ncbi:c-type cytochrome [Blattabacterium cuenoti]|uniref:c-type cytochrome n=1 Tax=Blattabacterium cuenoti TaxID=1653831 RepID=UPI00163BF56D|nr:c-type cytochrome [Blattabacterium cuenoti]
MKKIIFSIIFLFFSINAECVISKDIVEGNIDNGKDLFKKNCTSCHSMDLNKKMIGPALSGITEKRNREWLHKWIKDNKSLRKSGDKEAIKIYEDYKNIEMNSFLHLSNKQIDDILFFIKNAESSKKKESINNVLNEKSFIKENVETDFLIKLFIFFLIVISIITILLLYRIYILYILFNKNKDINLFFKKKDFFIKILYKNFLKKSLKNWYLLFFFLTTFIIFNIYLIWSLLMRIDVNKGYQPEQPIYFSHKIHSGINKIDCEYCHSNAKYGKTSGIPSANICMNCHITINEYNGDYIENGKSKDEYDKEIKKIYYAIGWDEKNMKYTGKVHPIKWIRIHNMPDFVYFDHSQHIISGNEPIKKFKKVKTVCNACHGEVNEMDQIKMSNDFTMEWCLSCHRNIEIDKNNQYYKEYFFQKNIKNDKDKKNTVDMIGGTECAKCHY